MFLDLVKKYRKYDGVTMFDFLNNFRIKTNKNHYIDTSLYLSSLLDKYCKNKKKNFTTKFLCKNYDINYKNTVIVICDRVYFGNYFFKVLKKLI